MSNTWQEVPSDNINIPDNGIEVGATVTFNLEDVTTITGPVRLAVTFNKEDSRTLEQLIEVLSTKVELDTRRYDYKSNTVIIQTDASYIETIRNDTHVKELTIIEADELTGFNSDVKNDVEVSDGSEDIETTGNEEALDFFHESEENATVDQVITAVEQSDSATESVSGSVSATGNQTISENGISNTAVDKQMNAETGDRQSNEALTSNNESSGDTSQNIENGKSENQNTEEQSTENKNTENQNTLTFNENGELTGESNTTGENADGSMTGETHTTVLAEATDGNGTVVEKTSGLGTTAIAVTACMLIAVIIVLIKNRK